MVDQDSRDSADSKVVPLFPPRSAGSGAGGSMARPVRGAATDELECIGDQVRELMAHAEPADAIHGPAADHRNALRCPQCDRYTWRQTAQCMHCGTDLGAHALQQRERRRERWRGLAWGCAMLSWAVALAAIYASEHYRLPASTLLLLRYGVYAIAAGNLLGFWIATMDRRR